MSWSSPKKKKGIFVPIILPEGNFFKNYVLTKCVVYWIHLQNMHTFTYKKKSLHTLLLLVAKIIKNFQCMLKEDPEKV